MSLLQSKRDKLHMMILPGDICVYKGEFCVYKKPSWGGEGSKGEFGKFIFTDGKMKSVKFNSVLFAFDPMGKRRSNAYDVRRLTKLYYEGE